LSKVRWSHAGALHLAGWPRNLQRPAGLVGCTLVVAAAGWLINGGSWAVPLGLGVTLLYLNIVVRDVWRGLLVFLFLMPILPDAWGARLTGFPILLTLQRALIVPLFAVWLLRAFQIGSWRRPPRWLLTLVVVNFALRFVSGLWAPNPTAALNRVIADSVEFVGLFFVIVDLVDERRIWSVLRVWVAGSAIGFLVGVHEFVSGWNLVERFALNRENINWHPEYLDYGYRRASSLFQHPISYAWVSSIAVLAAFALLGAEKREQSRRLWWVAVFLNMGSLMLSFSRGPILALTLALLTLMLLSSGRQRIRLGGLAGAAVVMVAVLALARPALTRAWAAGTVGLFKPEATGSAPARFQPAVSLEARRLVLENGLRLVAARPFGYGYTATTRDRLTDYYDRTFQGMAGFENAYIHVTIEMGPLGLASLLSLFLWILRAPRAAAVPSPFSRRLVHC